MTNDKSAEYEASVNSLHRAAQIWCEDKHAKKVMDPDFAVSIAKALDEAHAAGRAEVLAEVLPVLEFYGDRSNWEPLLVWNYSKGELQSNGKTLDQSVEPDEGQRARALLEKLK